MRAKAQNPTTLTSIDDLGGAVWHQDHYAEAEKLIREPLETGDGSLVRTTETR